MKTSLAGITMAILCALHTLAQQSAKPEFEAVSVKPANPDSRNGTVVNLTRGGGLRVVNATVKDLIETAYEVRDFQIAGGPSWTSAARFDVIATPGSHPSQSDHDDVRLKVQSLLKDRFQLQLHRETRNAPMYSLVVAKGGVKPDGLVAAGGPAKGVNAGPGTMIGESAPMSVLASKLARLLIRPVVDNTGLKGNYDFKLQWTPDTNASLPDGQAVEASSGPSLFTALQEQLGLRLEAQKGPVDFLVIDSVDKPSAN